MIPYRREMSFAWKLHGLAIEYEIPHDGDRRASREPDMVEENYYLDTTGAA